MKKYIALQLHEKPQLDPPYKLKMPEGCCGLLFAFTTKKAARAWCGRGVELQEFCSKVDNTPFHIEGEAR